MVMQAVLKPASARPKAARRPAPPAPLKWVVISNRYIVMRRESSHDDSIEFMFDQWVLSRGPGLETALGSVHAKNRLLMHTLTSSAFTGLVATTRATEADEWKARDERRAALGSVLDNIAVGRREGLCSRALRSPTKSRQAIPANHALVIYPHPASKPPASEK